MNSASRLAARRSARVIISDHLAQRAPIANYNCVASSIRLCRCDDSLASASTPSAATFPAWPISRLAGCRTPPLWGSVRWLHSSSPAASAGGVGAEALTVPVPHMGDSITEGTIAAILKSTGDAVEMDEVLLQIETDKVTIDVRAPSTGVIQAVLVKEGENVLVNQDVLRIAVGATGGATSTATSSATSADSSPAVSASPSPTTASEVAPVVAAPASDHSQARTPMIKFPIRRLPDGSKVVDLSPEEMAALLPGKSSAETFSLPQGELYQASGFSADGLCRPLVSQREMDMVELGGAEP